MKYTIKNKPNQSIIWKVLVLALVLDKFDPPQEYQILFVAFVVVWSLVKFIKSFYEKPIDIFSKEFADYIKNKNV